MKGSKLARHGLPQLCNPTAIGIPRFHSGFECLVHRCCIGGAPVPDPKRLKKITQCPPLQTNSQLRLALEGSYPLLTKCWCLDRVYPRFQSNQRWSLHFLFKHMASEGASYAPQQQTHSTHVSSCLCTSPPATWELHPWDATVDSASPFSGWRVRISWQMQGSWTSGCRGLIGLSRMPPNHSSQFLRHSNILSSATIWIARKLSWLHQENYKMLLNPAYQVQTHAQ